MKDAFTPTNAAAHHPAFVPRSSSAIFATAHTMPSDIASDTRRATYAMIVMYGTRRISWTTSAGASEGARARATSVTGAVASARRTQMHRRIRVEAPGGDGLHEAGEEVPRRDAVVVPAVGRREAPPDADHVENEDRPQHPRQRGAGALRQGLTQRREARGAARGTHRARAS